MEAENIEVTETLESEVKAFADLQPYWARYLADKLLKGQKIEKPDVEAAFNFLLEDLKLMPESVRPEISVVYSGGVSGDFKGDLLFQRVDQLEGINALVEHEAIEFGPNVTVVFGANGAGKSGYVRLFKKTFYSKAPEEILPNVHADSLPKSPAASFTFSSSTGIENLRYPADINRPEFRQFAVFDGKSVLQHLNQKNEFEFRPAGLGFFADYTEALKQVEDKLATESSKKRAPLNFTAIFDGDSEIKAQIEKISAETKISELRKYLPYTEIDKLRKKEVHKLYDDLLVTSLGREKEMTRLKTVLIQLNVVKKQVESINQHFTTATLSQLRQSITEYNEKAALARTEGIEKFKTNKISGVGTPEWKNFLLSAEKFASKQKEGYPEPSDSCLLCQQELVPEASHLISSYWEFLRSVAEREAANAFNELFKTYTTYEEINFDLFGEDKTLTVYLKEKHTEFLSSVQNGLQAQKAVSDSILTDLNNKTDNLRAETIINISLFEPVLAAIEHALKMHEENSQTKELAKLLNEKTFLIHKEKLEANINKIEEYVSNLKWLSLADSLSWHSVKATTTNAEKKTIREAF